MIEKIKIDQYRKLKNIELNFSKGINAISGTNGTCKTSILHLFSTHCLPFSPRQLFQNSHKILFLPLYQ